MIASEIYTFIVRAIFAIILIGVPLYLTVFNAMSIILREKSPLRRVNSRSMDILTIVVGTSYSMLYISLNEVTGEDWDVAIYQFQYHNFLYGHTIHIVVGLFLLSLLVLSIFSPKRLPPLVSSTAMAMCSIGLVAGVFILVQLVKNLNIIPIAVYYVNLLMVYIRVAHYHITEHVKLNHERDTVYRNRLALLLSKVMERASTMRVFTFSLIVPIFGILEAIFILCGQGADGFIKAFTMTADWTFSNQTPPPPIEYDGHYLCTVAVQGHERVVKPLRYGKRLGKRIVVNRQLLVANAFEDLIKERLPRFHRVVRHIYDTYGYPISKYITTKNRADTVYLLMKPLECVFILVLYLFDTHPENRIAIQYSDYKKEATKCR